MWQLRAFRTRQAAADTTDRPSEEKVVAATSKDWDAWFSILDRAGGKERKHGENASFLVDEHGVPSWWSQAITMWYERSRGLRLKHQQADGFTVVGQRGTLVRLPGVLLETSVP